MEMTSDLVATMLRTAWDDLPVESSTDALLCPGLLLTDQSHRYLSKM